MHKLKKWRIGISLAFFLMFLWEFLLAGWKSEYFTHTINALQFFPSLLEFTATFLMGGGAGFIIILALAFIFGRVYCSFLCPLGVVQDMIIHFRIWILDFRLKNKYEKPLYALHYVVTAAVVVPLAFGAADFLGALDPFANFGRMATVLVKPAYVYFNNAAAYVLSTFDIYAFKPRQMHHLSASLLVFTAGFFVMIVIMSVFKGRFYCNTLCPVGGILSLASRTPVYRIKISAEKCTECGLCEKECKANCIDYKNAKVDHARCVACFNCLGACEAGAVTYSSKGVRGEGESAFAQPSSRLRLESRASADMGRREAIKAMTITGAGAALLLLPEKLKAGEDLGLLPEKRKISVIPPGAKDLRNFNSKCISCQLCVSACPSKVITSSFMEGAGEGFFQPRLDFSRAYCNYSCNTCSHVCPTGALLALTVAEKKIVKIGEAKFVKKYCVVETKGRECHVCNEYCPTKACSLVPYKNGLRIPEIKTHICIGCGACENRCPATPKKAIYVEGLVTHKKAEKPGGKQKRWRGGKEFPF